MQYFKNHGYTVSNSYASVALSRGPCGHDPPPMPHDMGGESDGRERGSRGSGG